MPPEATIYDIARRAGVGIATVSRVLNGSGGVAEATRRAVQKAMGELGYRPNRAARRLAVRGPNRPRVAAVMQDDQLFVGTIEDNISFFDTEHDPARVRECARIAMIDEEIMAMPMQYNTIVGSLGTALSGGQKQRVLLARALYRLPKILFLDEAFDQIDVALERRISTAIAERGIALVIVSHRPETIASSVKRMEMRGNFEPVKPSPAGISSTLGG
jgi:ABC-type transport system involved in Fe-S cluster assembly fused permease/ATPase subunit